MLSKAERSYCVTRRELLAVVTFLQHFRPYLPGRYFIVRTDHGSLTWLRNFKNPENQLARWLERMQEYDFDIVYRPGRKHGNADALSRVPCKQRGGESPMLSKRRVMLPLPQSEPLRKLSQVCPSRTCGKHSWLILT